MKGLSLRRWPKGTCGNPFSFEHRSPVLLSAEPGVLALFQKVLIGFPQPLDKLEFSELKGPPCVKGAVSEADWGIDNPSGKNQ